MILFLLKDIGEHPNVYAERWGPTPGSRMQLLRYDDLLRASSLTAGSYIFSDLDVLSDAGLSVAKAAWERLSACGLPLRLLNDPSRALGRFDLLSTLHAKGINRFRVLRADRLEGDPRFPVFVRYEKQHTGPLTPLLHDERELRRALRYLRLRGHRLGGLLVVEFCDASDSKGIFRKYSSFLVGDRVLPRHLFFSREWMVKEGGPLDAAPMDPALEAEKTEYLYGNPHELWVKEIFRIAGLDFGRIDYGRSGDSLQVWEVNSNPTMRRLTPRLTSAFEAIDHPAASTGTIAWSAEASLVRERSRERRRERIQGARLRVMDGLTEVGWTRPVVGLAKRLLRWDGDLRP
jgi:hypothetical protein